MEYRIYNPGTDQQAVLEVRSAVWGANHPHTNTLFLDWLFQKSPVGVGSGIIMYDKEKSCGFVGISPRTVVYGEQELRVAHCLDFMARPSCRSSGVSALKLANHCVQAVREQQYDFSFAYPNGNSLALVTSPRCGYKTIYSPILLVRPLPRFSIPKQRAAFLPEALRRFFPALLAKFCSVRAHYALRSMPEGAALQFERFDAAFDELWRRVRPKIKVAIKRDAAYLNWRFLDNPVYNYRLTCWSSGDSIKGYIVSSDRQLFDIPSTLIVDLLADDGEPQVLLALIAEEVKQADQNGSCIIATQAIYGTKLYHAFCAMGFIPIPRKLNPKPFHLTVHDLEHDLPLLAKPNLWFFTWSDMDVV